MRARSGRPGASRCVLADDLVEGPGPQAGGERRLAGQPVGGGRGEQVVAHPPDRTPPSRTPERWATSRHASTRRSRPSVPRLRAMGGFAPLCRAEVAHRCSGPGDQGDDLGVGHPVVDAEDLPPEQHELVALGPVAVEARRGTGGRPSCRSRWRSAARGRPGPGSSGARRCRPCTCWRGTGSPAAVDRPQHPRLEIAVARVVAVPPLPAAPRATVASDRPGAGRSRCGALGDLREPDQPRAGGGRRRRGRGRGPSGDRSDRRRCAPATSRGSCDGSQGRRRTARGCGGSSAPRHRSAARGATTPRSGAPDRHGRRTGGGRCRARPRRPSRSSGWRRGPTACHVGGTPAKR